VKHIKILDGHRDFLRDVYYLENKPYIPSYRHEGFSTYPEWMIRISQPITLHTIHCSFDAQIKKFNRHFRILMTVNIINLILCISYAIWRAM
jgi:hypothetical protein